MSLTLLAALTLSTVQPADTREPEVVVIDRRKDVAMQVEAAADKSFERLDKNGSGVLESSEIPNLKVRTIRLGSGSEPATGIGTDPARADENRDGRVTRAEYRAWMGGVATRLRSITEEVVQNMKPTENP